jgi:predicted outer membrane protein
MATRRIWMWLYALALGVPGGLLLQAVQPEPGHAERGATLSAAAASPYRSKQKRLRSPLRGEDAQALLDLHRLHDAEISIGRLAQGRAKSAQARRSGQQLALDHTRRDQYVVALARQRRVEFASLTPTEDETRRAQQRREQVDRLQTLTGDDFDREFGKAMLQSNASAVSLVAQQRARVQDPDLRLLIDGTLPMLKQHLDIAHKLSRDASQPH